LNRLDEEGGGSLDLENFLRAFQKYRITSFKIATLETEWKTLKNKSKNPIISTETENKRLRSENGDLREENEILRRENEKLKIQIQELNQQWTEITVTDKS